jgi:hypothetical protein
MEWDAVTGGACPFKPEDIKNMSSGQVREFMAQLLEEKPFSYQATGYGEYIQIKFHGQVLFQVSKREGLNNDNIKIG